MPLDRGKPCLEIIGHDLGCEHADRMRPQMRVEPVAQTPGTKCLAISQWATCASACTPASVRPAPLTRTSSPQIALTACSSAPCTVGALSWICQPENGVPSYSMMSL